MAAHASSRLTTVAGHPPIARIGALVNAVRRGLRGDSIHHGEYRHTCTGWQLGSRVASDRRTRGRHRRRSSRRARHSPSG